MYDVSLTPARPPAPAGTLDAPDATLASLPRGAPAVLISRLQQHELQPPLAAPVDVVQQPRVAGTPRVGLLRRSKRLFLGLSAAILAVLWVVPQEEGSALLATAFAGSAPRTPPGTSGSSGGGGPRSLPAPSKRAAVVYCGRVGRRSNLVEAAASWSSLQLHLVARNAPRWRVDTFFHTWERGLTQQLAALLLPVAHGDAPAEDQGTPLDGRTWLSGPASSAEIALQYVVNHTTARGLAPYDRVIVLRFDAVLLSPFNLDALADDGAFYASNWCLGTGAQLAHSDDWLACHELVPVKFDHSGLPDFWFGGSQHVVTRFYRSFTHEGKVADFPSTGAPKLHGIYRRRWLDVHLTNTSTFVLRRYMYHFIDFQLFRFVETCGGWDTPGKLRLPGNRSYFDRGEDAHSPGQASECGSGRYLCARDEPAYWGCNWFNPTYRL